jgi:nitroreductase
MVEKFEKIILPKPIINKGLPLLEAITKRKTSRDFNPNESLTLQQISEILYCAYGQSHGENNFLKTVPSAVSLQPLEIFCVFKIGIFKYNPIKNELIPCMEGNYSDKSGSQPYVKDAYLNILIFSDMKKEADDERKKNILNSSPETRLRFSCLDAGHCCQNVYLYCASEGLKCVIRALCDGEYFKKLLKLSDNYDFIVSQSVGK